MINLMYIVLTAMLALNVSSDVLDGFVQVHEGLSRSNANIAKRNQALYDELEVLARQSPEKARALYDSAGTVRARTAALYDFVDSLKLAIVRRVDGPQGNPSDIVNRDDLEAAAVVMLAPGSRLGEELRHRVNAYRTEMASYLNDSTKLATINDALNTDPVQRPGQLAPQTWEEAKFEQQPVVAAVTLLSKLQTDILYTEGEVLAHLLGQVGADEVHVNQLDAFVIPQSRMIIRGGRYDADVVLAAIDTTARPEIYIGNTRLNNGHYSANASTAGTFTYNGYILQPHSDGTSTKLPFSSSYTVIEPMATVSATMMNVLYAGIDNPISISVPGVPMADISATMTNGTLTRSGDHWVARATAVGKEATINVTANIDGRSTRVADMTFRIRKLPDPTAFIAYTGNDGNPAHYKGGRQFAKASLLAAPGLEAAIDDGLLNTRFNVTSFQTIFFDQMGNAMIENSNGPSFSNAQKQRFQGLKRGKRFYISNIKATGPDGISRDLPPIEVIVG